ncbi:MAG: efflux RND transporter permease subunit [Desulfobacteraceae bacterium]
MFLTRFGIERPVVVRMTLLLVLILGVVSYRSMPRYLDPDLTVGEALIITVCPGFSPEDMEKLVTNRIEEELQGISEIRRHDSNSFGSTSKIHVFFQTDLSEREIDQGMQEVRNAVDRVDDLPEEAETPRVLEIDTAIFPVCLVGLSGPLPMAQLQDIASEVGDVLEDIDGVSEISIYGEREKEIWVEIDPLRMAGYGITVPQVARALAERSRNRPGGVLEMGDHESTIRLVGEPDDPEMLADLALRSSDGATVFLGDVARINPTLERAVTRSFIRNEKALVLAVKRKKNTNMIRIVDDVKRLMAEIGDAYPGLTWTLYFDQARVSKKRIWELQLNALLGVVAVFLILWIALGLRNAIYASIGIPVAFLITFTLMKTFGLSIDGVTLFGLILVLGILVDDAIVVLENIFRHMEGGMAPAQAALHGSREVLGPVLASVTTNMAAFAPLLFMVTGVIGRYLSILPQVVLFALSASLFEVYFMLPSHVVELTPKGSVRRIARRRGPDLFTPLRRLYYPYLRRLLRHRYVSVLVIVGSTVLAFLLYFQTDFEMFPKTDAFPRFNIHFDLPVGASLDRTEAVLMGLSDLIAEEVGTDLVAPIAIAGMKEVNYEPLYGPHFGMLNVVLTYEEERDRSVKDTLETVREPVERYLKAQGAVAHALERLLEGPPVGADVDLKIQAPEWSQSAEISRRIQEEMARHAGIVDIRDDFSRDKPFLEVTVNEARARELGVSQADLEMMIQAAFHGLPVATYNRADEEQEIKLKVLPAYRRDFQDLTRLRCVLPGGRQVPLQELATIRMTPGFHDIYHYNGKPTVQLTANIRAPVDEDETGFLANLRGERMTAVKANRIARDVFDRIRADYPGARMIAGGLQEETNTSLLELRNAGFLALFLIFFILALQFNSFGQPFIIMITIPFVTLGVIIGLLVTQNPLTFVTLVGLLTLTGIVVNDSLVLIDFINRYRREHPDNLYLAILRACHVRMRPILLTSLTTIFGLAPMAFGLGGKSPFWAPLATAIMWGLAFATALILSMVPAYYAILQDLRYVVKYRHRPKEESLQKIEEAFMHPDIRTHMGKGKSVVHES